MRIFADTNNQAEDDDANSIKPNNLLSLFRSSESSTDANKSVIQSEEKELDQTPSCLTQNESKQNPDLNRWNIFTEL